MNLKFNIVISVILLAIGFLSPDESLGRSKRVLVFSKTAGYYHKSIPTGIAAIQKLGKENGFLVDTTTNSALFNLKTLKKYSAVVFLSTTGDILNEKQQLAFEKYIKSGGGFAGIHAAADTEYEWPWYGKLVGAYFISHPKQQEAILNVTDAKHLATRHLPSNWKRKDEWYNYKSVQEGLSVLIKLDENSYNPGKNKMGDHHPISWYRNFDGGRTFYTGLGHTDESYADPLFLKHILGGIQYAMGIK